MILFISSAIPRAMVDVYRSDLWFLIEFPPFLKTAPCGAVKSMGPYNEATYSILGLETGKLLGFGKFTGF